MLLPCPHCGDPAELDLIVLESGPALSTITFQAACSDRIGCGGTGPKIADEDAAAEAWNRVADAAGLDPMVQWGKDLAARMLAEDSA